MNRFFVSPEHITGDIVSFSKTDSHHIAIVLRLGVQARVTVLDGAGSAFEIELTWVSKTQVTGKVLGHCQPATEPRLRVTIAQALPKTLDKLEWVIQHGAEIGAAGFIVFTSSRSRRMQDSLQQKVSRWREIIRSAAEQSGRTRLPQIDANITIEQLANEASRYDLALVAFEKEASRSLAAGLLQAYSHSKTLPTNILIVIGPEGGFSEDEAAKLQESGFVLVSLGPRILRTETAALSMLSQILFFDELQLSNRS